MDHLLFCVNHPEKVAKRHCNMCNQDICNECVFESHIEHHTEITKIEYKIDIKQTNFAQILSKEIKTLIDKSFNDLKPKIYQLVLDKTEEYIKGHKNLQLKLNQTKEIKKEKKPIAPPKPIMKVKKTEKEDNVKNNYVTKTSNISERAKMFYSMNSREIPKKIDENNPINKKKSTGGVRDMAKMFE